MSPFTIVDDEIDVDGIQTCPITPVRSPYEVRRERESLEYHARIVRCYLSKMDISIGKAREYVNSLSMKHPLLVSIFALENHGMDPIKIYYGTKKSNKVPTKIIRIGDLEKNLETQN